MYGAPQEIAKKLESINTVFSEINEVFWPFFEFNKNRPAICNPRLFHIRRSFQRKPNQISTGRNDISAVTCHPLMEPRSQAPKAIRRLKRQLSLRPAGPMTPCESAPTLLITAAECSSSKQSWSIWQIMEGSCILKLISSSSSVLGCEDANKELLNFSLSTCASHKNRIPKERATNQRVPTQLHLAAKKAHGPPPRTDLSIHRLRNCGHWLALKCLSQRCLHHFLNGQLSPRPRKRSCYKPQPKLCSYPKSLFCLENFWGNCHRNSFSVCAGSGFPSCLRQVNSWKGPRLPIAKSSRKFADSPKPCFGESRPSI